MDNAGNGGRSYSGEMSSEETGTEGPSSDENPNSKIAQNNNLSVNTTNMLKSRANAPQNTPGPSFGYGPNAQRRQRTSNNHSQNKPNASSLFPKTSAKILPSNFSMDSFPALTSTGTSKAVSPLASKKKSDENSSPKEESCDDFSLANDLLSGNSSGSPDIFAGVNSLSISTGEKESPTSASSSSDSYANVLKKSSPSSPEKEKFSC